MPITASAIRSASRSKRSPGALILSLGSTRYSPAQRGQPPPQAQSALRWTNEGSPHRLVIRFRARRGVDFIPLLSLLGLSVSGDFVAVTCIDSDPLTVECS